MTQVWQSHYFSIVIPCFNCEATISACVRSIMDQTYSEFEVLLVDDVSTDRTMDILLELKKEYFSLRILCLKEKGFAGGARNVGKENSLGDIVVFLDSDVTVNRDYLEILNDTYNRYPRVNGIGGSVVDPYNTIISNASYFLGMSEFLPVAKMKYLRMIPTLNVSFRRALIKNLFFLEKNTASEDAIFGYTFTEREGRILFNPRLIVFHHHPRKKLFSMLKREAFYAKGFVMSRRLYNLPGKFLLDYKILLCFFPRMWLLLRRIVFSGFFGRFMLAFPLIFCGEVIRMLTILREDRKFLKSGGNNRNSIDMLRRTELEFTEVKADEYK